MTHQIKKNNDKSCDSQYVAAGMYTYIGYITATSRITKPPSGPVCTTEAL